MATPVTRHGVPATPTAASWPSPWTDRRVHDRRGRRRRDRTPFKGPRTNLAGLFQVNGVASVRGLAETWNTWHPAKPLFGLEKRATLTVYAVKGTAPAVVPARGAQKISNTVRRGFTINN